jgi:anti-sigma B factor antagonist
MTTQPADGPWPTMVALPAEIDTANASDVLDQITAAATGGVKLVIADMTATTFCDSSGIGALLQAHQRAVGSGAELRLILPSRNIKRVMSLVGADRVLMIYESLFEAMTPTSA